MTTKSLFYVGTTIVALGFAIIQMASNGEHYSSEEVAETAHLPTQEAPIEVRTAPNFNRKMDPPQTQVSRVQNPRIMISGASRKEFSPPLKETLRQEVAANPHSTPSSMMRFSDELGEGLKGAFESDEGARKFFSKVTECVRGEYPDTIQALCLVGARALSNSRPRYAVEYKNLIAQASAGSLQKAGWVNQ